MKQAMDEYGIAIQKNGDGSVDFMSTMVHLREKLGGLDETVQANIVSTIFGKEAMAGWQAVINATDDDFNNLTKAIAESEGTADKMATTMQEGASGAIVEMKSAIEGVAITIGERLLPFIERCADWISSLCAKFQELSPEVQNAILIFGGLLAVIPPILVVVGNLMTGFATLKVASAVLGVGLGTVTGAFVAIPVAIAGVIAIIASLIANWDWVKEKAKELADKIGEAWNNCLEWTKEKWSAMWDAISNWWSNLVSTIANWISPVTDAIKDGWNACVDFTKELWTKVSDAVSEAWDFIGNLVEVGVLLVKEIISAGVQLILLPWTFLWENCKDFVMPIFEAICDFVSNSLEKIKTFVSEKLEAVKNFFVEKFTAVKDKTTEIYEAISNTISEKLEQAKSYVSEKLQAVANFFAEKWNTIKSTTSEIYQAISSTISEKLETAKSYVSDKLSVITSFFSEKWNAIKSKTSEVYQGIAGVVSEKLETAKSYVSEKVNTIRNYFSEKFESAKGVVGDKMNAIRQNIQDKMNSAKDGVSNALNTIKSKFDIVGTIHNNVKSKFDSVKTTMTNAINGARDAVNSGMNKIKNILNVTLSSPRIKMPHFTITGKFSLNPPSVPKFSIKWYNKGAIFKHKTVLPGGIGVGDASFGGVGNNAEAILPINKLPELLGLDKNQQNGGLQLTIENFNNNREQDIEHLANELAFYLQRKSLVRGV